MAEWFDEVPDEMEDLYDIMYRDMIDGTNDSGFYPQNN